MTKARDIASAIPAPSTVSSAELGFLDGVTSAVQTQIDTKAASSTAATLTGTQTLTNKSLTSPALTGTPTAPTASVATNTTQIATTAFVLANAGSPADNDQPILASQIFG